MTLCTFFFTIVLVEPDQLDSNIFLSSFETVKSNIFIEQANSNDQPILIPVSQSNDSDDLIADVLPANIVLQYDNKEYQGKLVEYNYRSEQPFSELRMPNKNISVNANSSIIDITQNSKIQLIMKDYPKILTPSNLAITVYSQNGVPIKLLPKSENETDIFKIDLNKGKYILLASVTWSQISDYNISGYVLYAYNINVV